MPNANARPRKRAADAFAENESHSRQNAKRPKKVLTKKVANKKQPGPAATASSKPKPSKSSKTKGKSASKSSSSASSSSSAASVSASSGSNTGCFSTTWTAEEDHRLKQLVMELYPDGKVGKDISWIDVVNRLGTDANGRTAKQVRERWHNSLRPDLKKKGAPWSEKETASLIRLQSELGNSWSKISKRMTCGRSQNDIKNKWNSLMKNQVFLVAYTARQKEVEDEKDKKNSSKKKKASKTGGVVSKGVAKFAAMMARKLCSRSNYVRDGEGEDLASTSEESDAYDSEDDDEEETNAADDIEEEKTAAVVVVKDASSQHVQVEENEMTEDGNGHLLRDVEQSESQLEFGRKLEQYKWAVEQEKKIDLFRRGRFDSGLTCSDAEKLKLMGLGLGVAALQKKYFGTASSESM